MAVQLGHALMDENRKASGGKAGDSTNREVSTVTWFDSDWNKLLRPLDEDVAETISVCMEQACANNKIGYDQMQRTTLYTQAVKTGYDLSKITTACECDCSSLVAVCILAAGIKINKDIYTGNMAAAILNTGKFKLLTEKKYLREDSYLKRGDILLCEGSHCAVVLSDGDSVVTSKPAPTGSVPYVAVANTDVNFRSSPSSTSAQNIITALRKGQPLLVVSARSDGWTFVKTDVNKTAKSGWIFMDFLDKVKESTLEKRNVTDSTGLNIRSSGKIAAKMLGTIPYNGDFTVLKSGEWGVVAYKDVLGYSNLDIAHSKPL